MKFLPPAVVYIQTTFLSQYSRFNDSQLFSKTTVDLLTQAATPSPFPMLQFLPGGREGGSVCMYSPRAGRRENASNSTLAATTPHILHLQT